MLITYNYYALSKILWLGFKSEHQFDFVFNAELVADVNVLGKPLKECFFSHYDISQRRAAFED
jgi:hypothetical protein